MYCTAKRPVTKLDDFPHPMKGYMCNKMPLENELLYNEPDYAAISDEKGH